MRKFFIPGIVIAGILMTTQVSAMPTVYPTGTTIYKPNKAWNGYTVFPSAGGGGCVLIDMNGNTVKHWKGLLGEPGPNKMMPGGVVMGGMGCAWKDSEKTLRLLAEDQELVRARHGLVERLGQAGAAAHARRSELVLLRNLAARVQHVGEDHRRAAEDEVVVTDCFDGLAENIAGSSNFKSVGEDTSRENINSAQHSYFQYIIDFIYIFILGAAAVSAMKSTPQNTM